MSKYIGTWLSGSVTDGVKAARMAVYGPAGGVWGTEMGTGWTPTLEVRLDGDDELLLTITGDWEDATEAKARFMIGEATSLAPVSPARYVDYEAIMVLERSGVQAPLTADDQAEVFKFRVQAWP